MERTKAEIKALVQEWGCQGWNEGYFEEQRLAVIEFRMELPLPEDAVKAGIKPTWMKVRMTLPFADRNDPQFTEFKQGYRTRQRTPDAARKLYEQDLRRRWRCLWAAIRQRFINIDTGISDEWSEFGEDAVVPETKATWREHIWLRRWETIVHGEPLLPQLRLPEGVRPYGSLPERAGD